MSVIARCAAMPSTCESAKAVAACTSVAAPAASASGTSRSPRDFPITSSMRDLGRRRQHEPRQPADDHEHEPDRQPSLARPDQVSRFTPDDRPRRLLLRRRVTSVVRCPCSSRCARPSDRRDAALLPRLLLLDPDLDDVNPLHGASPLTGPRPAPPRRSSRPRRGRTRCTYGRATGPAGADEERRRGARGVVEAGHRDDAGDCSVSLNSGWRLVT